MNSRGTLKRAIRTIKLDLESLDRRIVPAVIHPADTLAAVTSTAHAAVHTELPGAESVSASARVEGRLEKRLERRIERRERAVKRLEKRLDIIDARREARYLRHHHAAAATASQAVVAASPALVQTAVSVNGLGSSTSSSLVSVGTASSASPTMPIKTTSNGTTTGTQRATTTGAVTVGNAPQPAPSSDGDQGSATSSPANNGAASSYWPARDQRWRHHHAQPAEPFRRGE